jgi:hypothetical protein
MTMNLTPEKLQKLADLLYTPVLDRTGFHDMFDWLLKDVHELGYGSVSDFVLDYELASGMRDVDLLDEYLPPNDEDDQ